jgi:hypothetical protein
MRDPDPDKRCAQHAQTEIAVGTARRYMYSCCLTANLFLVLTMDDLAQYGDKRHKFLYAQVSSLHQLVGVLLSANILWVRQPKHYHDDNNTASYAAQLPYKFMKAQQLVLALPSNLDSHTLQLKSNISASLK